MESSTTHRLVFFRALHAPGNPASGYVETPSYAADEIDELRAFIDFLFPTKGQDRFKLHRPDTLEPRWLVWDSDGKCSYALGQTAREAVRNARMKYLNECEGSQDLQLEDSAQVWRGAEN